MMSWWERKKGGGWAETMCRSEKAPGWRCGDVKVEIGGWQSSAAVLNASFVFRVYKLVSHIVFFVQYIWNVFWRIYAHLPVHTQVNILSSLTVLHWIAVSQPLRSTILFKMTKRFWIDFIWDAVVCSSLYRLIFWLPHFSLLHYTRHFKGTTFLMLF